ncbi:MAG: hypothetical protein U0169_15825 [Polyangiaceae bacterium]
MRADPLARCLAGPLAGPEAVLANGYRMPPGKVVSHVYLVDDAPEGTEWFEDVFPPSRDESFVAERTARGLDAMVASRRAYVLRTSTGGVLALPSHTSEGPVRLLFSHAAHATAIALEGFDGSVEELPLDEVIDGLLPDCESEDRIGLDWTADLVGAELCPSRLRDTLVEVSTR